MWVYQQTGTPAHLPEAALLPQPQKTLPPERSAPEVPSPLQRHNTETRQKTCWLLVCAFLIGSGSAGVLLAFCEKQQPDWLQPVSVLIVRNPAPPARHAKRDSF